MIVNLDQGNVEIIADGVEVFRVAKNDEDEGRPIVLLTGPDGEPIAGLSVLSDGTPIAVFMGAEGSVSHSAVPIDDEGVMIHTLKPGQSPFELEDLFSQN